jgi:hypothetical protein
VERFPRAHSPDGKKLVSGGEAGSGRCGVQVWDATLRPPDPQLAHKRSRPGRPRRPVAKLGEDREIGRHEHDYVPARTKERALPGGRPVGGVGRELPPQTPALPPAPRRPMGLRRRLSAGRGSASTSGRTRSRRRTRVPPRKNSRCKDQTTAQFRRSRSRRSATPLAVNES